MDIIVSAWWTGVSLVWLRHICQCSYHDACLLGCTSAPDAPCVYKMYTQEPTRTIGIFRPIYNLYPLKPTALKDVCKAVTRIALLCVLSA